MLADKLHSPGGGERFPPGKVPLGDKSAGGNQRTKNGMKDGRKGSAGWNAEPQREKLPSTFRGAAVSWRSSRGRSKRRLLLRLSLPEHRPKQAEEIKAKSQESRQSVIAEVAPIYANGAKAERHDK